MLEIENQQFKSLSYSLIYFWFMVGYE